MKMCGKKKMLIYELSLRSNVAYYSLSNSPFMITVKLISFSPQLNYWLKLFEWQRKKAIFKIDHLVCFSKYCYWRAWSRLLHETRMMLIFFGNLVSPIFLNYKEWRLEYSRRNRNRLVLSKMDSPHFIIAIVLMWISRNMSKRSCFSPCRRYFSPP